MTLTSPPAAGEEFKPWCALTPMSRFGWRRTRSAWALPTRPTKPSDTRSKNFGEISVELDAIEPNQLRALVQEAIELYLPVEQFEKLKAAEESERDIITRLVGNVTRKRRRSRRWRG